MTAMSDGTHARAVHFVNKSGEEMPPRACGRIDAIASSKDQFGAPVFEIKKPDAQGGPWIVNGDCPVANNASGLGWLLQDATIVLGGNETAVIRDSVGPTDGEWQATTDGSGLIVLAGKDYAGNLIVMPEPAAARLQVRLNTDLLAAVNTKRDPSTAVARVYKRKANGDLKLTIRTETVVNRFLNISIDAGTYCKIEWIDGEYQPYAADCPGDSSSGSGESGGV